MHLSHDMTRYLRGIQLIYDTEHSWHKCLMTRYTINTHDAIYYWHTYLMTRHTIDTIVILYSISWSKYSARAVQIQMFPTYMKMLYTFDSRYLELAYLE